MLALAGPRTTGLVTLPLPVCPCVCLGHENRARSCCWGIVGKGLFQQGTFSVFSPQWAPEEISLEGNKDDVEMLRSQMHRCSMRPDDLTSDE